MPGGERMREMGWERKNGWKLPGKQILLNYFLLIQWGTRDREIKQNRTRLFYKKIDYFILELNFSE